MNLPYCLMVEYCVAYFGFLVNKSLIWKVESAYFASVYDSHVVFTGRNDDWFVLVQASFKTQPGRIIHEVRKYSMP